VFIGLYPNDSEGQAAVAAIADHHIQPVLCARRGPTTKADCLNHLWRALVAHEACSGTAFKAVVLYDAEDIIHPQKLWVFDALVPRLALVQLPVLSLPDAGSRAIISMNSPKATPRTWWCVKRWARPCPRPGWRPRSTASCSDGLPMRQPASPSIPIA
jgi:hypothetical protein